MLRDIESEWEAGSASESKLLAERYFDLIETEVADPAELIATIQNIAAEFENRYEIDSREFFQKVGEISRFAEFTASSEVLSAIRDLEHAKDPQTRAQNEALDRLASYLKEDPSMATEDEKHELGMLGIGLNSVGNRIPYRVTQVITQIRFEMSPTGQRRELWPGSTRK